MALYNDKVMDHFMNPRNVGEIENPDGSGTYGSPVCCLLYTSYRTNHGYFKSVNGLLNVSGIGEKTLAKIKDRLCV